MSTELGLIIAIISVLLSGIIATIISINFKKKVVVN